MKYLATIFLFPALAFASPNYGCFVENGSAFCSTNTVTCNGATIDNLNFGYTVAELCGRVLFLIDAAGENLNNFNSCQANLNSVSAHDSYCVDSYNGLVTKYNFLLKRYNKLKKQLRH